MSESTTHEDKDSGAGQVQETAPKGLVEKITPRLLTLILGKRIASNLGLQTKAEIEHYYEFLVVMFYPLLGITLIYAVKALIYPTSSFLEFFSWAATYLVAPPILIYFVLRPVAQLLSPQGFNSNLWKESITAKMVRDKESALRILQVIAVGSFLIFLIAWMLDFRYLRSNETLNEAMNASYTGNYNIALAKRNEISTAMGATSYRGGWVKLIDESMEIDRAVVDEKMSHKFWSDRLEAVNGIVIYDSPVKAAVNELYSNLRGKFADETRKGRKYVLLYNSENEKFHKAILLSRIYSQLERSDPLLRNSFYYLSEASRCSALPTHATVWGVYYAQSALQIKGFQNQADVLKKVTEGLTFANTSNAPKQFSWLINLTSAELKYSRGDKEGSRDLYMLAAEQCPSHLNFNVTGSVASSYQYSEPETAIELLNKAISQNPTYTLNHIKLAIALARLGNQEKALKELERTADLIEQDFQQTKDADTHEYRRTLLRTVSSWLCIYGVDSFYERHHEQTLDPADEKEFENLYTTMSDAIDEFQIGAHQKQLLTASQPTQRGKTDHYQLATRLYEAGNQIKDYPYVGIDAYTDRFYQAALRELRLALLLGEDADKVLYLNNEIVVTRSGLVDIKSASTPPAIPTFVARGAVLPPGEHSNKIQGILAADFLGRSNR